MRKLKKQLTKKENSDFSLKSKNPSIKKGNNGNPIGYL